MKKEKIFKITAIAEENYNTESTSDESKQTDESDNNSDCSGNCDYYKTLCKANGLFVLTKEDNFIVDIIDQISDPVTKGEMLQKYLEQYNGKKPEKNLKLKEPETYSHKEILNRAKSSKEENQEESCISESMHEVKVLKREINDLKSRVSLFELKIDFSLESDKEEKEESSKNEDLSSLTFVNMLDRVITHKCILKLTSLFIEKHSLCHCYGRFWSIS